MRKGAWPLFSFDLVATHDSFIALSAALEPLAEANREAAKNRAGAYARIRPVYMEALLEKAGGLLAPDANSTLRVTYGQVRGVDTGDDLFYKPQTTLGHCRKAHGQRRFRRAAEAARPHQDPVDPRRQPLHAVDDGRGGWCGTFAGRDGRVTDVASGGGMVAALAASAP